MATPIIPIDTLPPAPSRAEPATFANKSDALLGALDGFVSQTNAIATATNANAALAETSAVAASAALASTSYAGVWSELTGALNTPASVVHSGFAWLLLTNLADVTLSEPGVSADWQLLAMANSVYDEFLASGTWTKTEGTRWVYVEAIGGGGGGAHRPTSGEAGGGSGGEFVSRLMRAEDVPASVFVTVGAGGLGGADSASNTVGATGGSSSFGSLLTAIGGNGGQISGVYAGLPRSTDSLISSARGPDLHGYCFPQAGYGSGLSGGGNCIYGGAGGAAAGASASHSGGVSEFGGNGGDSSPDVDVKGGNGSAPGGGGGGSSNGGGGGDGGSGRARIWAW